MDDHRMIGYDSTGRLVSSRQQTSCYSIRMRPAVQSKKGGVRPWVRAFRDSCTPSWFFMRKSY